jgi:hypothetical protein
MVDAAELLGLLRAARQLRERDPLSDVRWTDAQIGWHKVQAPIALWRGGNQLGKTYGQDGDAAMFGRNQHPYDQTHRGPVKIAICSKSWKQMDPFVKNLWDMLPRHEIDPKVHYVPGQGIKGYKEPILPLVDGPGAGTEYRFFTYDAGTQRLAGQTFHRAYLDEPPPETFWGEIVPRLNVLGGHLRVSFTPTPDAPPQLYLRKMVQTWEEAGRPALGCPGGVYEHHTPLTEEVCIPRGGLFELPFMTAHDIANFGAALLPHERQMRLEGAWEPVLKGRWLEYFDKEACVHSFPLGRAHGPPPGAVLIVGIDHGAGPGKQAAALVAVDSRNPERPGVWVMATTVAKGYTTPEQDARAIFDDLLRPWGLQYADIDHWVGDRSTNANHHGIAKGNAQLKAEIARLAGIRVSHAKWIETPKKFQGSVVHGFRSINAVMSRRRSDNPQMSHFLVAPSCKDFVTCAQEWRGDRADPRKDLLDAVRYAVEKAAREGMWEQDLGGVIQYGGA